MRYMLYGVVRVIEATLFYFLAFFVTKQLKSPIPPIGSQAYVIFVIVWPFVAPVVEPGLRTIPVIGEIFGALDMIARSCLGRGGQPQKNNTTDNQQKSQQEGSATNAPESGKDKAS